MGQLQVGILYLEKAMRSCNWSLIEMTGAHQTCRGFTFFFSNFQLGEFV